MAMIAPVQPPFPLAGEAAALGAALIWSGAMGVYAKYSADVPASTLNFFKGLIAIICLLAVTLLTAPRWAEDPWALGLLAGSGVIGIALGDTAMFAALNRLGAQITSSCQCLAPPIAAIIAMWILGETLTLREALGMLVTAAGVAGIILMSRRQGAQLAEVPKLTVVLGVGLALLAALCQGAGIVMSRQALQSVDVIYGTLARIAPALLVLGILMLWSGKTEQLRTLVKDPRRATMLALASFAGTCIGLILMSAGVKYAKAGIAAALNSTCPIWIIPIAHFVLKERVTWPTAACTCVAVAGIVMMLV